MSFRTTKTKLYFLFSCFSATESFVIDRTTPAKPPSDLRAQRAARRITRIARWERYFSLMASGYTCHQIARMVRASVATVRREIDQALAERPLDTPERFAQVQVARLVKALRLAEAAIELGELKAAATYLRIVAALDRYHELAAGPPPPLPRRSTKAPPLAVAAPPKALSYGAPTDVDALHIVDERIDSTDETKQG
jgi:hypothetical protein